jgi:hypothetical protein
MKDMFFKKSDIYYSKWATVVQKFQLSMTKLGNHDEIRWFDGTIFGWKLSVDPLINRSTDNPLFSGRRTMFPAREIF